MQIDKKLYAKMPRAHYNPNYHAMHEVVVVVPLYML